MNLLARLFGKKNGIAAPAGIPFRFSLVDCTDDEFVEACYRCLLQREPDPLGRANHLEALRQSTSRLEMVDIFIRSREFQQRKGQPEYAPPGHFYSPVPAPEDIASHRFFDWGRRELPMIDLAPQEQQRLLEAFREIYPTISFPHAAQPSFRYHYENPSYSYGDAILSHCMIRLHRPARIVEAGSGNSSCLILDTNERFFEGRIQCTFLDPHPEYLQSLLGPDEAARTAIRAVRLQDADMALFERLEANDILFIDSTHVSKLGSDVNWYMFEIFPRLKPGVLVHIHDVNWPFEYQLEWLEEGRAWNEQYLLRAFLMGNDDFRIRLLTTYLFRFHREWFERHMPLCLKSPGGSIWIQKVR